MVRRRVTLVIPASHISSMKIFAWLALMIAGVAAVGQETSGPWRPPPAGYGQQAVHVDNAALAASSCDTIQADLRIGDLEHAFSSADNLVMVTAGFNPEKREEAAEGGPQGDIRETVRSACEKIVAAYAANDIAAAQQAAANLRQVLAQAVVGLPATPQARFARMDAAVSQLGGIERFYRLVGLAKAAFDAGEMDKASAYGHELLDAAGRYATDWNYGNAIYFGNWVLGRIALQHGDAAQAGEYLLRAGATPGSPQLNSFGPNTKLAQELLEKGQTAVVLQYFGLCTKFWKMENGKLAAWAATVKGGGVPNFGANLLY
jgi:hypothetical protein